MPTNPTYPGVYVEEIPSGVRTIVGVATSITAFLGRAVRGEVNKPTIINNFGDFERNFGGLQVDYPMSYAVQDFYLNGGSQAIIVRLFAAPAGAAAREVAEAADREAEKRRATRKTINDAAHHRADPIKSAADAVATAAQRFPTSNPDPKTVVKDAAAREAAAIKSAADAVVTAARAVSNSSPAESIKEAASQEAAAIEKTARAVQAAVQAEITNNPAPTPASVKAAVRQAADRAKAPNPSQGAKDAAEAVAKAAEDQPDDTTLETVKQVVRERVESIEAAAGAVARAAEYEATNNPGATAETVKEAASQEAAAIKKAADAVPTAAQVEVDKTDSTKETIRQAARAEADAIGQAADDVIKEVEGQPADATVNGLKDAARAKAEAIKASNPRQGAKDAAEAVARAVEEEVTKYPAPTSASVKDAARAKAEAIKASNPGQGAKDAAEAVAKAAGDQPNNATVEEIKQAAADAAEGFNGIAKKEVDGDFRLQAASPGMWGNNLEVKVDHEGVDPLAARDEALKAEDLFNLTIRELSLSGQVEREENIRNVSVKDSARRVDRVLEKDSQLVRLWTRDGKLPNQVPADTQPLPETNGHSPSAGNQISGNGAGGVATLPRTLTQLEQAAEEEKKRFRRFDEGADSGLLGEQDYVGSLKDSTGIYALEKADLFNLLCIPPDVRGGNTAPRVYQEAIVYCYRRRAMLIVDPPVDWGTGLGAAQKAGDALRNNELKLSGAEARNAALYFPRVKQSDLRRDGQIDTFAPSGMIAGVMASTDVQRAVWKAPAGIDASLKIDGLQVELTDAENGMLNPLGINCLRRFPIIGNVVWGARTLRGADQLADEYKYVPVRRLALYIEESLYRGLKWVVFEPNDEPLWAQIRLNVGAFMHNLFRQGAFQGQTPQKAYFVKCDHETTTQNDVDLGIVNIVVGFAPLKPAEFVILKLQQMAGEIEV